MRSPIFHGGEIKSTPPVVCRSREIAKDSFESLSIGQVGNRRASKNGHPFEIFPRKGHCTKGDDAVIAGIVERC